MLSMAAKFINLLFIRHILEHQYIHIKMLGGKLSMCMGGVCGTGMNVFGKHTFLRLLPYMTFMAIRFRDIVTILFDKC